MTYNESNCSCEFGQRSANCDWQSFLASSDIPDERVVPEGYSPEECPFIEGGINFVGCEKWVRTFIDGDTMFDVPTQ